MKDHYAGRYWNLEIIIICRLRIFFTCLGSFPNVFTHLNGWWNRQSLYLKMSAISLYNDTFLTYLGQVTKIEMILSVMPPKVAKACTTVICHCRCCFCQQTSPMYTSHKRCHSWHHRLLKNLEISVVKIYCVLMMYFPNTYYCHSHHVICAIYLWHVDIKMRSKCKIYIVCITMWHFTTFYS